MRAAATGAAANRAAAMGEAAMEAAATEAAVRETATHSNSISMQLSIFSYAHLQYIPIYQFTDY
jgi:hypothetical protein